MRYTILSCISSLLLSGTVYAADCVTSFDQSCVSHSYESQPVEEDREYQREEARAREKAEQEQADAQQGRTCEAVLQDMALQQRAYEQSIIANQLAGGFELRADELRGLSAVERKIAKERFAKETPAALIARSREELALRQAEVLRDCNRRR